jgi:hypothetical protein
MANPQNGSSKSKPAESKRSASAPAQAAPVVAEAPSESVSAEATAATETPTPAIVAAPSAALAVTETKPAGEGAEAAIDPTLWSKKSLDLWSENAAAFLDFTERLAKAKTLDEITSLQSRFVSERLDSLMRQSTELMTLAQRLMSASTAPLYGVRAA